MRRKQARDLGRGDQRDVAGQGQHAGAAFGGEQPRRRGDRAGMAVAGALFDHRAP